MYSAFICRQPIDYYHAYNRFQCRLTTFPFQSDFMSFARLKLDRVMSATDSFIIKKSFSYSGMLTILNYDTI